MCGIAGIVGSPGAADDLLRQPAERMAGAMRHRGPDSRGAQHFGPCWLVNTRLAIIDLSERGRQPMSTDDGALAITYNGETYNAAELRADLERRGHRFHSHSDTEVVLHLYQEYGPECVRHLRGMFAFAIWDSRENRLVLARDRLGIKPLYTAVVGEQLVFASEIKALLESGLVPRKMSPSGLRAFLALGHIPPPWTILDSVTPLEPGHIAIWKEGRLTAQPYWQLAPVESGAAPAAPAGPLAEELLEAMRNHLVSDVPIAVFLSSGADSACLAAAAAKAGAQNLTALTIGFSEAEFDESELARRTAESLGLPHRVITLSSDRVRGALNGAIWAMDQPTVDGLNSYWISRLTAESGFKVALSGQGGDELFGGYTSLAWFERFAGFARWTQPLPSAPVRWLLDHPQLPFRWRKLEYLFGGRDPFLASQLAVKIVFPESDIARLVSAGNGRNGLPSEAERHLARWASADAGLDLRERLARMDIHAHLEPRLLRDLDAMSMAHSLEVRPVFLDHRLVEFTSRIPSRVRIQNKRLLLDAARAFLPPGLEQDLRARPKRTFTFPFARWLGADLRGEMEATFAPERLRTAGILEPAATGRLWRRYAGAPESVGWSRIWSLFVLERWSEAMRVTL